MNGNTKKTLTRVALIVVGSAVYWMGYYNFFQHLGSDGLTAVNICLIVVGLFLVSWNSSYLFRRK